MKSKRTKKYIKNLRIEEQLIIVNRELSRLLSCNNIKGRKPKKPVLFVIGLQRSGTTLLMQLLTQYFYFTYPDNIVARFWKVPYIGILVSRSLKHQFKSLPDAIFDSDYGVTSDSFGPHEFGYFWKNYFKFEPTHYLTKKQRKQIRFSELNRNLFLMEYFGEHPLLFKVVPLSYNCDFLAKRFPDSAFIYITRDPIQIAISTYLARIERYGDPNIWWSLKPKQYGKLIKHAPHAQVAGQIKYSLERIQKCLKTIPEERKYQVSYESLCQKPIEILKEISERFSHVLKRSNAKIPNSFELSKVSKIENKEMIKLDKFFKEFNH